MGFLFLVRLLSFLLCINILNNNYYEKSTQL